MPNQPEPSVAERDPRIYFAAERTLLAWTRTGIALMGFGFAIARFGLYLRQLQATNSGSVMPPSRVASPFTGTTLMVIGILCIVLSTTHYTQTIRQLREGSWIPGRISKPAVTLSIVLIAVGIFMVIQMAKVY